MADLPVPLWGRPTHSAALLPVLSAELASLPERRRYRRPVTRRHTSCFHTKYVLTCGEYDGLLRHADGYCTLCRKRPRLGRPLNIDHDHALGQWAVRGLVCDRCNQILRRVEAGEYPM